MIDEKKLIEAFKKHFDADYGEDGRLLYSDHVCTGDDVEDIIKLIEEQLKVGEWIPCSERLPEEDGTYLITVATASNIRWVRTGMLYSDSKFNSEKVLAWMPLPEPYKEGE